MNFGCGIVAFLFIETVHSLNLTSVDQHSELAHLKQELNNLKTSIAAMNSTFNSDISRLDQHSELDNLKQELNNQKTSIAAMNSTFNSELLRLNNELATKSPIAFTACLGSAPKVLGAHQTLEFNHVIFNEGGAFDPRHGVFRAPVSGVYQFTLIFLNDVTHTSFIEIVKDGVRVTYAYSDARSYNTGAVQVIIKLDAGQDVWCRNARTSDKSYMNLDGQYSCFSGHSIS